MSFLSLRMQKCTEREKENQELLYAFRLQDNELLWLSTARHTSSLFSFLSVEALLSSKILENMLFNPTVQQGIYKTSGQNDL